jgi:hypothetical protein
MKPFIIAGDANGAASFAIPFCDYIDVRVLVANVAETVTVPSAARLVLFSATGDFYARIAGTAGVPSADVIDGSGSELNPVLRAVAGVASFSVIAPSATTITLSWYA